jgi:hypothetical protein
MKSKLMTVIVMLCVVIIPFVGASTRGIEKSHSDAAVRPAPQTSATYRVVLNGFRANRETYDTAFETDGKGDEVFIVSEAGAINGSGEMVQRFSRRSKVYGDINGFSDRVQAGFRSDQGGLKTDDRYPADRDLLQPRPAGAPIFDDRIPMLLWQGELFPDQNAVVIMPTIWEWDLRSMEFPAPGRPISHATDPALLLRERFDRWLGGPFGRFVIRNRRTFTTPYIGTGEHTGVVRERSDADIFTMGTNGTRIIGLRPHERLYNTDILEPVALILTQAAAEQALRSGNGVFRMTYEEPRCCGLEGSYTLYLQLERMPSVTVGP